MNIPIPATNTLITSEESAAALEQEVEAQLEESSLDEEPSEEDQPSDTTRFRLQSLENLRSPQGGKRFGYTISALIGIFIACLFLPWQQTVSGDGSVTAFNPANRPQTVQNIIAGRIQKWYINEGMRVKRGDTLLSITEIKDEYFDPLLTTRISEQIAAKLAYIAATKSQIDQTDKQIASLVTARELTLAKTGNKVIQARNKIKIDSGSFEAQKIQYTLSARQLERYRELYEKNGLISLTEFEKRRQTLQEKLAYRIETENKLLNSRNELLNARIELNSVEQDYREKLAKARSDRNYKQATLADADSEISKLRNKMSSVGVRQEQYVIKAPQNGIIVRALKAGIGELIKEGEPVATIAPIYIDRAVEIYVRPMDIPLLRPGQQVRLEFDGWPAFQFSGWSNASVGTFGGRVSVIDYVASNNGYYRILVKPDSALAAWPEQIRLGSGAKGWAMLSFVTVGYELWRQLNGFPPNTDRMTESSTTSADDGGIKSSAAGKALKTGKSK
jgi:membrane fusion protein, adhesin transport system